MSPLSRQLISFSVKLFFFFSLWPTLHDEGSLFKNPLLKMSLRSSGKLIGDKGSRRTSP
uniref:Uncharacterized protein n=1 Tax=Sparus aurata TaxID=8175 RepID=A0A671WSH5_SPAAU